MRTNKKTNDKEKLNIESIGITTLKKLSPNSWLIDEEYKYLKNLNFYISIIDDFEFVIDCISELQKIKEKEKFQKKDKNLIQRSLFISSISTYGRCFTGTKKNGRIWLDKNLINDYFPKDSEITPKDLIKFHDYIMDLRHKYIAHADENIYESTKTYIDFEFDYKSFILTSSFKNYTAEMFTFDEIQMNNFKVIANFFLEVIKIKEQNLIEKLKKEIGDDKLKQIGIPLAKKVNF